MVLENDRRKPFSEVVPALALPTEAAWEFHCHRVAVVALVLRAVVQQDVLLHECLES